jgi:hypothetical protein
MRLDLVGFLESMHGGSLPLEVISFHTALLKEPIGL